MDYSSYPQQDDQQYQQYHQQQQEEQQHQSYDSSQFQPYDHSSQSYYSYTHHHHYPYYHSSQDYTNSYAQQTQTQTQFHQEPTSIHPPGVPIPPEPAPSTGSEQTQLQNPQNAYYPPGVVGSQPQLGPGSDSDPNSGLNPATAVALLSQLNQFAGNVDAGQRAMHPPIGQTSYRGSRGNRPFRRGRSHYGPHGSRPDGSAPSSFRGRGRGQGGSKHFVSHGAVSTNFDAASALAEGVAALTQQPSASVPGQAPLPAPEQVPPVPFWQPPRMAWCELCRVDCTTPEILEQHKNGKKHKKNLQVFEELQKLNKVNTGQQNAQMSNTELKPVIDIGQSKKVEGNQPLAEKTSEVMTNDNSNETEQQCAALDNSEDLAEPEMKHKDRFPARGRGSKRKMRGGRGGKYMRGNEGSRRPVEPPKPKVVVPLICELCNVKCESQVVFDSHLSGKKHQSNLKRFHGHRALYGEAALQALYPPNFNAPSTSATPQAQQDVNDPQVLLAQLLMNYVLSQTQAPGTVRAPPTTALASAAAAAVAAITGAPGSSYGTQNQPDSQTQGSELASNDSSQNALVEITQGQLQSLTTQSEATPTGDIDIKTVNETSTIAVKNVHVPLNNTNMVPGQNSGACEQVSGMVSVKTLSSQQSEFVFSEPEEPTP